MVASTNSKGQATVFYSWQSDLPNATNRGFIQDALERAAKAIRADDSVEVDPVPDRDTQNVPGAPDIAQTIFSKIENSTAFVADVSIINPGLGRPTPNPNVLIELGYALKKLGHSRTILIANTVNGSVESLPFDLRTKRVLTYQLVPGAKDKAEQRKRLQQTLEAVLRAILADMRHPAGTSLADKAIESIENNAPSQRAYCTRFVEGIAKEIAELTPKLDPKKKETWDDELVEAIHQSLPLVTDFARVADTAAIHDSKAAALGLFRGLGSLFSQYTTVGYYSDVESDLPKFIGHELIVVLYAAFITERRWSIVSELCDETTMIQNYQFPSSNPVTYVYAAEYVKLLDQRNKRLRLGRALLHADILKERHEFGQLGEICPWRRFQDADVFLYLRSPGPEQGQFSIRPYWLPWSAALLGAATPEFLLEAARREKANQLLKPLGVKNLSELQKLLKLSAAGLQRIFSSRNPFYRPLQELNLQSIGID